MSPDPSELLLAYVTAPADRAPELVRALVEQRLAACGNIIPGVRSIYRWKDAVQDAAETLIVLKTTRERFEALRAAIVALHPYEVPEVLAQPAPLVHEPYAAWVREMVRPR